MKNGIFRVFLGSSGEVIFGDDGFGCSAKFGQIGEVAGRPSGGRIQESACREDVNGSERK